MAMEENEKMEALKKAYAETILNTSKEAAVRVMVSERKAQQFEHDLRLAKEEAYRLLLRLKQMLDAKTAAAEIMYSNQKNKIDELEAQLNEAEGVIVDLRVELKQAEEKLDEVKKQNVQPSNRQFEMGYTRSSDQDMCMSKKQTVIPYLEPEKYFMNDQVLSSLRSIEPELYRNGCTQRIRAIERAVDEKGLPEDGPHVPIESEAAIISNELAKISSETERFNPAENVLGSEPVFARGTKDVPLEVCKNRKRKILHGKSKPSSCSLRCCRSMRSQQPTSVISHCKFFPYTSKTVNYSGDETCPISSAKRSKMVRTENCSEMLQKLQPHKDQAISVVRRSLRKRKVKQWDDFTASCGRQGSPPDKSIESSRPWSSPSCCKPNLVKRNIKSCEEKSDIISEIRISEDADNITGNAHLRFVKHAKKRNSELIDESVAVKPELTDGALSQVESNKIFKYTFSRKCKEESLVNHDGNSAVGKSSRKRRFEEKQNNASGPLGSNMRTASPEHNRGLVQIAQQLISLSGRDSQ